MDPIAAERLFQTQNQEQWLQATDETAISAVPPAASRPFVESCALTRIFQSFSGTFLFTVFFAVLCYFVTVTIVNPRGVFWGRSFPQVMPNTRALKLDFLQKYNRDGAVDLVVLGSSRSTKLSPVLLETLTGQRTFNAGVFSGGPNDYLSLYRVMKQRGIVPKTLVVGLDAEALDPATAPAPDFESNFPLKSALNGTVPTLPARMWHWAWLYKESLNPYYIKNISESIWLWFKPRPRLFEFQSDGHEEDQTLDVQIQSGVYPYAEKVGQCESSLQSKFADFQEASPELERNLKQLLSEAAIDKVRVVLWITPMHPKALSKILNEPQAARNFQNAETHLTEIGAMFNLPVRNLTDSRSFGGNSDTWYDCVHYSQIDADRIAKALFKNGI